MRVGKAVQSVPTVEDETEMSKAKKQERHDAQAEEMQRRGYITVAVAAERALRNVGAIYRALQRGKLNGTQVGDRKYVADDAKFGDYLSVLGTNRATDRANRATNRAIGAKK